MATTKSDPLDDLIAMLRLSSAANGAGLLLVATRLRALERDVDGKMHDPTAAGERIEQVLWLLVDAVRRALHHQTVSDPDDEQELREALRAAADLGYDR